MTEEVKEIIEYLKNDNIEKPFGMATIDKKRLLNYITNLQKENEELKDTIKKDNHLLGCNFSKKDKYKQEKDIYKQRNEKAVEYIKNTTLYGFRSGKTLLTNYLDDLLNILEGGDE